MVVISIKCIKEMILDKNLPGGKMEKYRCIVCEWVYDPAENNNVAFQDLPEDWVCPECGVGKDQFEKIVD